MSNFTTERGFLFPSFDPLEEEGERIALVKRKWTMPCPFFDCPALFAGSGCLPFPGALPAPVELLRELLWGQVSEGEGRPPFVEIFDVGPDAFLDVLRFVEGEIGEELVLEPAVLWLPWRRYPSASPPSTSIS